MKEYKHLSVTDRRRFYAFLDMGLPITEIAKKLCRNRSTLYRELKRNQEEESYLPVVAHQKAQQRISDGRSSKITSNKALHEYILRGLKKGWSPEQIAGRMRVRRMGYYACHETIYRYIYKTNSKQLYHYLTYKKPKRRRRNSRKQQRCRFGELRLIGQRPEGVNTRASFGHWEGDTIAFSGTKEKVVTTLVERKSRMLYLIKNERKYSRGVMDKIGKKLEKLPYQMHKTITFDQGVEFADCRHLEQQIRCSVYYCETHSPWQKGSNENMNGRLRWYLPRETSIDKITQEALDKLAEQMNLRPRKCIGFKTPKELFRQQYKNYCRTWS